MSTQAILAQIQPHIKNAAMLSGPCQQDCGMETPTAVSIILTDGSLVYDQRCIGPADLPWLNQAAQETTDGELWWEIAPKEVRA